MYCMKLGRSDKEFWNSTLRKIFKMIEMYISEQNGTVGQQESSIEDVI